MTENAAEAGKVKEKEPIAIPETGHHLSRSLKNPKGWKSQEDSARPTTDDFFALGLHHSSYQSPEKRVDLKKPSDLPHRRTI